jgi:Zn ribbon nucleic-acid-binding protein
MAKERRLKCSRCKRFKPESEFYRSPAEGRRRRTYYCKPCARQYNLGRRKENQKVKGERCPQCGNADRKIRLWTTDRSGYYEICGWCRYEYKQVGEA